LDANGILAVLFAPVVIVAVYVVSFVRVPLVGTNVAAVPAVFKVTVPVTATPPGAATVKVVPLIVAALIAWLKVALIAALTATFEANARGVTDSTLGTLALIVVKLHT
jgi:hypothetical protein